MESKSQAQESLKRRSHGFPEHTGGRKEQGQWDSEDTASHPCWVDVPVGIPVKVCAATGMHLKPQESVVRKRERE